MPVNNRRNHPVHGRAAVADFICPDNGFRGKQVRQGVVPKDFMKENYRQLKQAQAQKKEDEEAAAHAHSSPRKSSSKLIQFRDVQSRVYEEPATWRTAAPNPGNGTVFLTRGASQRRLNEKRAEGNAARRQVEEMRKEAEYYSTAQRPSTPTKMAVPARTERGTFVRNQKDFINANKEQCPASPRTDASVASVEKGMSKPANYGRVPKYLEQRKAQWKEEQDRQALALADKDCPKGMKLMKEDERVSTLETLQQSKVECQKMLSKLPFTAETMSARKKVEALETRLKEIENAIGLFSKQKVYIAKD